MLTQEEKYALDELESPWQAETLLRHLGYTFRAGGCFSNVFTREDSAVKVCGRPDGTLAMLEWITKTKPTNPAFPRIHWLAMKLADENAQWYIAEMEILESADSGCNTPEDWEARDKIHQAYRQNTPIGDYPDRWRNMFDALSTLGRLNERLREDHYAREYYPPDLHGGNWMYRGTQPVITDPFSGRYSPDKALPCLPFNIVP